MYIYRNQMTWVKRSLPQFALIIFKEKFSWMLNGVLQH